MYTGLPIQMKNLLCKRLVACLCMKPPPSPSLEPPQIYRNVRSIGIGNSNKDSQRDNLVASSSVPSENEMTKKLFKEVQSAKKQLKEIRHILDNRAHGEEQQRYEADKENEMKNDWMLAAAVLDRICAIVFTAILVAGTVIFFVLFAVHP